MFARDPSASTDGTALGAEEFVAFEGATALARGAADADTEPERESEAAAEADADAEADEDVWKQSSFDLRHGADIVDFSDTLPREDFDRLFRR